CGVKNLNVVNTYICSTVSGSHNPKIGVIAGQIYMAKEQTMFIKNIHTHGIIAPKYGETKNDARVSGVIALTTNNANGTMIFENLVSDVDITSNYTAGGVIGMDNSTKGTGAKMIYNNLVNYGDLTLSGTSTSTTAYVGGVLTSCDCANPEVYEINNCANYGNVKNEYTDKGFAGGILAYYAKPIKMNNVLNTGTVVGLTCDPIIGGIKSDKTCETPVVTNAYTTTDAAGLYATKVADASVKGANALAGLTGFSGWLVTNEYPVPSRMTGFLSGDFKYASVRLAATQETAVTNGKIKVRLIGTVDSLEYANAGFDVKVDSAATEGKNTKTVFRAICYSDGEAEAYENYFSPYVYAIELGEISATGTVVIEATAFTTGLDGAKVSTAKYTVTYTDGALVSAVVSQ
ncbi:MAG: hypothetical protein ACI3XQ_06665, partial [Eubacteriales bacterium]